MLVSPRAASAPIHPGDESSMLSPRSMHSFFRSQQPYHIRNNRYHMPSPVSSRRRASSSPSSSASNSSTRVVLVSSSNLATELTAVGRESQGSLDCSNPTLPTSPLLSSSNLKPT